MLEKLARDVMTQEIEAIPETATVHDLAAFLTNNEISGAPVEDESGQLVGVVSVTDLARSASEGGSSVGERRSTFYMPDWEEVASPNELDELHLEDDSLLVRDIMTPTVLAVELDMPVPQIAKAMLDGHVHRLLVIDNTKVVGIVSSSDLLRVLAES